MGQRAVIVAGWLVAAVLAVLVGVVGIGLVGLAGGENEVMSEADVEQALSRVSDPPSPSAPPASPEPSTPAATVNEQSFRTRGGTVVADCDGISTMSPAQGYEIHEKRQLEGEFRSVRDNHVRVKVKLTCVNGVPDISERDDD
ncbi:hypothetical protein [Actinoplanes sp. HUAS TT8]|uniref:hypothetical protein n=1 Tax=Actinoplanes sp. HUAS TT8 TaxID=3447453 RepID=UPI003F527AA1